MEKMCTIYKDIRDGNSKKYIDIIGNGSNLCEKCGRVAENPENLCCPMNINENPSEKSNENSMEKEMIKEVNACSIDGCEHSDKYGNPHKPKKIEKMREDELRQIIREEVYDTVKLLLKELQGDR